MASESKKTVFEAGKNLILAEKYDEALKYFKDLLAKEQKNAIFANYIGIIYFLKKEYKTASEYFKQSIEIDPNNWYSYYKLGEICTIKNIDQCAIKYFTETIEKNPKNINALINLALIFKNIDDSLAMELINSALLIDPLNFISNYLIGTILLNKKEYKSAEEFLTKVIKQNPRFLMGWYNLGLLYFKSKKFKKSISALNNALAIEKKSHIFNLLGLIFLMKHEFETAITYFKEAIKLDSDNLHAWINLADSYLKQDKTESAKLCLKEALKVSKSENQKLRIWASLATCYDKEDRLDYSLYCFEKASSEFVKKDGAEDSLLDETEPVIELLHDVSQNVDRLKSKGATAQKPPDLNGA